MDACVMCRRNVKGAENWIKRHLWGGFAFSHLRCFGEYLQTDSEQVDSAVWETSRDG